MSEQARLHRRGQYLEWFTVSWNAVEAIVAIGAGIIASSTALVAFGADSLIEIASAGALLWRLHSAGPEASFRDRTAAESRALYLVAGTFLLLAVYIGLESAHTLLARDMPDTSTPGLMLSVLSLLVMPTLAYAKQQTGRAMGSKALQADAAETWVCVYLSFALLAGLGLYLSFGWWWADPIGALAMLPVILWQGWKTFEDARQEGQAA